MADIKKTVYLKKIHLMFVHQSVYLEVNKTFKSIFPFGVNKGWICRARKCHMSAQLYSSHCFHLDLELLPFLVLFVLTFF